MSVTEQDEKNKKPEAHQDTAGPQVPVEEGAASPDAVTVMFERESLLASLKVAKDVCEKRMTMPVLSTALFEVKGGKDGSCRISATNIENYWRRKLAVSSTADISVCVPVELFHSEVKALSSDITSVELVFADQRVSVNGRCQIFTMPAEEFPSIPKAKGDAIEIPGLADKVKQVLAAAGQLDTRYILNSVMIDRAEGFIVGCDGHRLHRSPIEKVAGAPGIIIPRAAAELIVKHKALATLKCNERLAIFSVADGELGTRMIDGTFPNHIQIFPKKSAITTRFASADFLKIMEGALPLSLSGAVKLTINGQMVIEAQSPEAGHYKWNLPCQTTGGELEVGFNAGYLMDALRSYPQDEAVIELTDNLSPTVVNGMAVVMPMRV